MRRQSLSVDQPCPIKTPVDWAFARLVIRVEGRLAGATPAQVAAALARVPYPAANSAQPPLAVLSMPSHHEE